jgi:hypothetical protein
VLAVGDFMSSVIDEGGYGRFGAYSRVELERFFYLDDGPAVDRGATPRLQPIGFCPSSRHGAASRHVPS